VDEPANQDYVREVLNSSDANTRLRTLLPQVSKGTGANQRIGNAITPIKFRVSITYYLDQTNTRGLECHVRQFLLTAKGVKNGTQWANYQTEAQSNMLDYGDGTNGFPDYGASKDTWANVSYPLAKETFTKLPKGNKTFKFAKQPGYIQNEGAGDGLAVFAPNRVVDHKSVVSIKCPKLKYEEAGVNLTIPTNFCPLWGACGYVITSDDNAQYRQLLGAISGGGIGVPANPIVRYTILSELWFKDD